MASLAWSHLFVGVEGGMYMKLASSLYTVWLEILTAEFVRYFAKSWKFILKFL